MGEVKKKKEMSQYFCGFVMPADLIKCKEIEHFKILSCPIWPHT